MFNSEYAVVIDKEAPPPVFKRDPFREMKKVKFNLNVNNTVEFKVNLKINCYPKSFERRLQQDFSV